MASTSVRRDQSIQELQQRSDALQRRLERNRRVLEVVYNISLACRGIASFREIFEVTYRELNAVFALDACYIALSDTRRPDLFRAVYTVDEGVAEYRENVELGRLTSILLRERRPLLFHDLLEERKTLDREPEPFGNEQKPSRSWLGVPLLVGQGAVGVVSVQSYEVGLYDEEDRDLLQRLGNLVAVVLENANLAQNQRELSAALADQVAARTVELAALSAIAAELVMQQPLPALLDRALDVIVPLLGLEGGSVRLLDTQRNELVLVAHRGFPPEYVETAARLPVEGSQTLGSVVRENRPLAIPSRLKRYTRPDFTPPFESLLSVPISIHDRVLGTLVLLGKQAHVFDQQQTDLAQAISNQIAIAIENARLFEAQQRQIAELDAIGQIGQLVSASYDLDEMLDVVYQALGQVTNPSVFYLMICDPGTQAVTNAVFFEQGERIELPWNGQPPTPGSLTAWIMRQRAPLLFRDLRVERERLAPHGIAPIPLGPKNPVRSWAGVPLLAKDGEPIGVLSVQHYEADQYDQQTIAFLSQVASHVSLGVQKARLFEERERQLAENARLAEEAQAHAAAAERQAQQMDLVNRISLVLSSRLDQQEVLDLAAREVVRLFWADHTGIVLFDEHNHWGTVVAEYPPSSALGTRLPLADNPITEELLTSRRPVCISSIATDPRAAAVRNNLAQLGVVSLMIVPLVSRGRVIGSIGLDSFHKPRLFTEEEQDLFLTVAAAIASAIENARLFAAEQAARRTADTLREVARVLSSSFDSREVLQLILRELRDMIAYDTASIMLLERDTLRIAAYSGWDEALNPREMQLRLDQGGGAWLAARRRRPVIIPNTSESPDWLPEPGGARIRSWLGVPLIAKGAVLGVLNIDSHQPNHFTARDAEAAQAFADQAAIALENARLYEESVTRVEQELEIARRIQSNLFPRALPHLAGLALDARCLPARETGGDFYDFVILDDGDEGSRRVAIMVGDASGKSIPGAMLMAIARSIARSEARDHQTPQAVMRETNRWIAEDVPPRSFVALCYALLDLDQRRLALANGGQLAPLRRRPDGRIEYLDVPGPTLPLGILPDTPYAALDLPLEPGDMLVFYTDGIVEAQDSAGQLFGFERLEALVREHGDRPPGELIDLVLRALGDFMGDRPQHDDMTIMALRIE